MNMEYKIYGDQSSKKSESHKILSPSKAELLSESQGEELKDQLLHNSSRSVSYQADALELDSLTNGQRRPQLMSSNLEPAKQSVA